MSEIRVRFAPSPTGYLHIGGARTALYNYLFAKQNNGKFLLRIEDTDLERSTKESENEILVALKWLGLNWDEDIVRQSDKLNYYKSIAEKMVDDGLAYYCKCTQDELEKRKQEAIQKYGIYTGYDRKCRDANIKKDEYPNMVIRFKTPLNEDIRFTDLIRGEIAVNSKEIDDFIIIRSDGTPTYNFSVVVDDYQMGITHVLRGDDHLANTPKQILIYNALKYKLPYFGHFPMILGADGTKLSKRHGTVSVLSYKENGYIPEGVNNYLAKLGWGYKNQEIFTMEELINLFNIKKISKSNAIFDAKKMLWVNAEHLHSKKAVDLLEYLKEFWSKLDAKVEQYDDKKLIEIIELSLSRSSTLKELAEKTLYFFQKPIIDEFSYKKVFKKEESLQILKETYDVLEELSDYSVNNIEIVLRNFSDKSGYKLGKIAQPLRVALTGSHISPGIFEVISLLGKEKTINYISNFLDNYL